MNLTNEPNWFERNPKKILSVLIFLGFLSIIFGAEKILQYKHKRKNENLNKITRYIRLRERSPLNSFYLSGDPKEKNLSGKIFRLRTDKDGFIEPSQKYEEPDKTIVFLGGSTTECLYMEEQNRFPYLVGVLLEQKTGLKINSYNSGNSGNDSLHSLNIFLNKVLPLRPNIAVMTHNLNDLTMLMHYKSYWNNNPSRSTIITDTAKSALLTNFKIAFTDFSLILKNLLIPHLYSELYLKKFNIGYPFEFGHVQHVRGKKCTLEKKYILDEFGMNLQTFINICNARKIIPVLMTQQNRIAEVDDESSMKVFKPLIDMGIDHKAYQEIYNSMNDVIREIGKINNIIVVDLDREIPHSDEYLYDIVHFNDKGSIFASEIIANNLLNVIQTQDLPSK